MIKLNKGTIVVCSFKNTKYHNKNLNITEGQCYKLLYDQVHNTYIIENDKGISSTYTSNLFITLDDYRKDVINNIINY